MTRNKTSSGIVMTVLMFLLFSLLLSLFSWSGVPKEVAAPILAPLTITIGPRMAGLLYLLLWSGSFLSYLALANLVKADKISARTVWCLALTTTGIFLTGYPAFSKDILNYAFAARIVTVYRSNPYQEPPRSFAQDPWLPLINWQDVTSPHGPLWLFFSLIPSFLGDFHLFLTLFLFKSLMGFFHLLSLIVLSQLITKLFPNRSSFLFSLYALNPLVLTETLQAGHYEEVMVFFLLMSLASLLAGKLFGSLLFWLFSLLTKPVTLVLAPIYLLAGQTKFSGQGIAWPKIIQTALFLISFPFLLSPLRRYGSVALGIHPWYFLWVFPLLILAPHRFWLRSGLLVSYFLPLIYLPEISSQPTLGIWLTFGFRTLGLAATAGLVIWGGFGIRSWLRAQANLLDKPTTH